MWDPDCTLGDYGKNSFQKCNFSVEYCVCVGGGFLRSAGMVPYIPTPACYQLSPSAQVLLIISIKMPNANRKKISDPTYDMHQLKLGQGSNREQRKC
jgi:hypothetical protein